MNSDGQGAEVGEGRQQLVTARGVTRLTVPQLSISHHHGNRALSQRREEEEVGGGMQDTTVSLETGESGRVMQAVRVGGSQQGTGAPQLP